MDGGFVKLATYLINGACVCVCGFLCDVFWEPVIFWIGHSHSSIDRGEERIRVGLKGRCDEKELSEKPGEIV